MKLRSTLSILLLFIGSIFVNGQNLELHFSNSLRFVTTSNDTIPYPFIGGFISPQFNEIDINLDGINDLMIFDRGGNKVSTFLNEGKQGQISYVYAPQYEEKFPRMASWVLCRDYNCDGKMDLFSSSIAGIIIHKNTSQNGELSFEHVVTDLLDTDNQPLYVLNADVPAIDDIDGDGDLDILSFGVLGGYVSLWQNRRVEDNLSCDSLRYKFTDGCWGSFQEAGFTNDVYLGDNCFGGKYYKRAVHQGSTILTLDIDEDGDKEMILGDVDFPDFKILTNGRVEKSWPYDTIIGSHQGYPTNTPVYIDKFPAAFYLDINNDGKKDLLASSNEPAAASNQWQNWIYLNSGKNNNPNFSFQDSGFLQSNSIDFGSMTKTFFFDIDGDGDKDLLVANRGNYINTFNTQDRVAVYERKGTGASSHFKLINSDWLSLSQEDLEGIHLCFGDLNNDGKQDMLMGLRNGTIRYYKNTGSSSSPSFNLENDSLGKIDAGSFSTPFLFDMDNDQDLDLLVGHNGGTIRYYENTGTQSAPIFGTSSFTDSLGRIFVNDYFWKYVYNQDFTQIIDSTREFEYEGFSSPYVEDMDDDGTPDIIVGSKKGDIFIYSMNLNSPADSFDQFENYLKWPRSGGHASAFFGGRTVPAADDVNGDGMPDLLIGNSRGGLHYLSSVPGQLDSVITTGVRPIKEASLLLYPNPTKNEVTLQFEEISNSNVQVQFIDLMGRVLLSQSLDISYQTKHTLSTSSLAAGTYLVKVASDTYGETTKRLVIVK